MPSSLVYGFHPDTLEYTGPVSRPLCPMQPQNADGSYNFLTPANVTTVAPGPAVPGSTYLWGGTVWTLIEDHRQQGIYSTVDGHTNQMVGFGPVPSGYTTIRPPDVNSSWNGTAWVEDAVKMAGMERTKRNFVLASTDWTQLPDAPVGVEKAAWATYRQALRDHMTGWTPGKPMPVAPTVNP